MLLAARSLVSCADLVGCRRMPNAMGRYLCPLRDVDNDWRVEAAAILRRKVVKIACVHVHSFVAIDEHPLATLIVDVPKDMQPRAKLLYLALQNWAADVAHAANILQNPMRCSVRDQDVDAGTRDERHASKRVCLEGLIAT